MTDYGSKIAFEDVRNDALIAVRNALREDVGEADVTTRAIIDNEIESVFDLISKDKGVLAGIEVFAMAFQELDPSARVETFFNDGDEISYRDRIATVRGKTAALLTAERSALNFLQHLTGVASKTREAIEPLKGFSTKLLDTRKTLPGLRMLQKYAVCVGGGYNHRLRLDSMFLIKENHIRAAGSIREAFRKVKANNPNALKIEIEVTNLDELKEAFALMPDAIMLDNMDDLATKKAKEIVGRLVVLEASGNITSGRLLSLARIGVDYVSMGALTHSVRAHDFSLLLRQ